MTLISGTIKGELKKMNLSNASYKQIVKGDVPSDRYFRNAWNLNSGRLDVNRAKAEGIHLDKLREKRDAKLKELDIESMRNISDAVKLAEIEERKQVLRDIPQTTDLTVAVDFEELKAIMRGALL